MPPSIHFPETLNVVPVLAAPAPAAELEEIVVWSEETGRDPVSPVSVLAPEDFEAINAVTTEDLVKFEPGVSIRRRFIGDANGTLGMRSALLNVAYEDRAALALSPDSYLRDELGASLRSFIPLDEVATRGVEFVANAYGFLLDALDLRFNLAWTDARIIRNAADPALAGKVYPGMPEWRGNLLDNLDNLGNEIAYVAHPWPGRGYYFNLAYDFL